MPVPLGFTTVPDSIKQSYRGRMRWYNIPNDVSIKDIYPLRDVATGQDRITPFYITYDPSNRGQYNYNVNYNNQKPAVYPDTMASHKKETFNGIMKYLNSSTTNLVSENINFIEFSMRVDSKTSLNGNTNAKLNIDLGVISEEVIPKPNGSLSPFTEDRNNNGTLEVTEDIGLDTLTNDQERQLMFNRYGDYDALGPDPSLDNNNTDEVLIMM